MQPFSVLMSLYIKEQASYFEESLKSVLNQTSAPNEIVIVLDGPITKELQNVIDKHQQENPGLYNIVKLEKNVGLGLALREGVLHCSNELIARMDTDDIARNDRFELQLKEFEKDPSLGICGSHILEFDEDINNPISKRVVPLDYEAIVKYQRRRDSFNHMTVMYKKTAVLDSGNYQSCPLMEDSYLWVNMLNSGVQAKNIDDFLVYARVGKDMYARRGGLSYFKKYKIGRKMIYKTGFISYWDYLYTILIQFVVAILPNRLRGFLFRKLLHR